MAYEENETVEVKLEDETASTDEPLIYDEESANLIPFFLANKEGKAYLKKLSDQVCEEYKIALDSSEAYRERAKKNWAMFAGDLPEKSFPHKYAANLHIPIAMENTMRVVFRCYGEIFNDWQNVCQYLPKGPGVDFTAQVLSVHTNWQLRNQIMDFRRQQMRGLLAYFFVGDITFMSSWDKKLERNSHEYLTPDEFVTPYSYTTTAPDYADLPYYVRIRSMYSHEVEAMKGEWEDVDVILDPAKRPSWDDEPDRPMEEKAAQVQGKEAPSSDKRAPHTILQYEGYLKLPEQDTERFCKVIFEPKSKVLLQLHILEEDDWQDRIRFERENEEQMMYEQATAEFPALAEQHRLMTEDANARVAAGASPPEQAMMEQQAMPPPPQPPIPPKWMELDETGQALPGQMPKGVRKVPRRLAVHGVCIEPLVGNLGLGYGRILTDMNLGANVALCQVIDQATANNAPGFLYAGGGQMPADFAIAPNTFHEIKGMAGADLQTAIREIRPGPPSDMLMGIVQNAVQWAQEAVQSPNVLSGEPGKSGEAARALAQRIEQATKQLTVISRNYCDNALLPVLRNNAYLNSQYLRDEEIISVTDEVNGLPAGNPMVNPDQKQITVGKHMYAEGYDVEIRADLRFQSQLQRIQEADEIVEFGMKLQPWNNKFNMMAWRKALEARGRRDMAQMLQPPPPPPPPPQPGAPPPGAEQGAPPPNGAPPPGPMPPQAQA